MRRKKIGKALLSVALSAAFAAQAALTGYVSMPVVMAEEETPAGIRLEDNFYEYINADTLARHEISSTEDSWSRFADVYELVDKQELDIIADVSKKGKKYANGSSEQKVRDLYECVTDMDNRNATGFGGLQKYIDGITNATTLAEYENCVMELALEYGLVSLIPKFSYMIDFIDSNVLIPEVVGADTLLGNTYYGNEDMEGYISIYNKYMAMLLMQTGMDIDTAADAVAAIDSVARQLSAAELKPEEKYDISKIYNVLTEDELCGLYSNIDMKGYLERSGYGGQPYYIVGELELAKTANSLLTQENLETLKLYSLYVLINDASKYTGGNYSQLILQRKNEINGIAESKPQNVLDKNTVSDLLEWDFARLYAEKYSSEAIKKDIEEMAEGIMNEYRVMIGRQAWMSEATKNTAINKLDTMGVCIAYPDDWSDYITKAEITPVSKGGSLISNVLAIKKAGIEKDLSVFRSGVADKRRWLIRPNEVNAEYSPTANSIYFPVAILNAPFYSTDNSRAANYGAIGMIIGHEITHAFDSTGALFDANGNYNIWWTDDEMRMFDAKNQTVIDYYNNYTFRETGMNINGSQTVSENIADLGAVNCVASILGANVQDLKEFYESYANLWAEKMTVERAMQNMYSDTHSPGIARVNAVVSSTDSFYQAYNIQPGDGMYVAPENRVGIWK